MDGRCNGRSKCRSNDYRYMHNIIYRYIYWYLTSKWPNRLSNAPAPLSLSLSCVLMFVCMIGVSWQKGCYHLQWGLRKLGEWLAGDLEPDGEIAQAEVC